MANNNTLLYVGGGIALLYLLSKSSSGGTSLLSNLTNSSGGTFTDATGHSVTRQPTDAENAGLTNPNYQLSAQNLTDYYNNYLDLQQAMNSDGWVTKYGSLQAALQQHWTQNGVTDHRTFIPLVSRSTVPFVKPPSSSGGGWFSTAVSDATQVLPLVLAVAGIGEMDRLNQNDINLIINSSAFAQQILPLFSADPQYQMIEDKMNDVLTNLVS